MNEIFPVLAGAALGAAVWRLADARLRALVIVVMSVVLGMTASFISGELALSLGFIPVDVAEVAIVSLLALGLITVLQRGGLRTR